MSTAIRIENVSKLYRLGTVGTGTLAHDLNRWWHAIRGKEDPYAKVGQVNDRTKGAKSTEQSAKGEEPTTTLSSSPSALRSGAAGPDYVWALRDINLEVQQGEILGIIGRNGAGKSTLLKLLSRVTAPTTGAIKTRGRIASLLEVGTGFHPEMTGRENIYMNGAILGMRRYEITQLLDEIVDFSGCAKYLDTPVKRYSSGMTVRLGFAVAAHLSCEILIIDEVLAVGDVQFQEKCIARMRAVSSMGRTILFVSHNWTSIQALCNKALLLRNGTMEITDSIDVVRHRYLNEAEESRVEHDTTVYQPNDQPAQVTECSIRGAGGVAQKLLTTAEDIVIYLRVAVRSPCRGLKVAFLLNTEHGVLFESHSADTCRQNENTILPGNYTYKATIAAALLREGRYWVQPLVGLQGSAWYSHEQHGPAFSVEREFSNTFRPAGMRLGTILPLVDWKVHSTHSIMEKSH